MKRPLLTSFYADAYRGLRELNLPELGRVNLLVGKNSSGKTSLLEAIQLYSRRGSWASIVSVVKSRQDVSVGRPRDTEDHAEVLDAFQNLFYGRALLSQSSQISIGPDKASDELLTIAPIRFRTEASDQGRQLKLIEDSSEDYSLNEHVGVQVVFGKKSRLYPIERIDRFYDRFLYESDDLEQDRLVTVSASGVTEERLGRLWDRITLTEAEDEVVAALRIITPSLERVSLVQTNGRTRVFMIRLENETKPAPLKIMGDGLSRLMGIALALVNATDGVLLIDEIENGLHYSVQEGVWDLIFRTAARLNVQVFAATHSWDCISAFQRAAKRDSNEQAMLIKMGCADGKTKATTYDERELAIATREGIEVR